MTRFVCFICFTKATTLNIKNVLHLGRERSGKGMSGKGRMWKCESCGLSVEASIPNCVCGRKKPQPAMKTGDWECPNCAEVVFANKIYCTVS